MSSRATTRDLFLYTIAIQEIPHQVRDDILVTIPTRGHHEFILIERFRINLSQNNSLDYFARQSGMTLGLKLQDYAIHLLP